MTNEDEHPTQEAFNDVFDEKINRYFIRHLWKLVGYLGYLMFGLGSIFLMQARTEHAVILRQLDDTKVELQRRIGQTEDVLTMLQIIESDYKKALNRAEIENDEQRAVEIRQVLEVFRKSKERKIN
jgi:tRNA splicing endonuclease